MGHVKLGSHPQLFLSHNLLLAKLELITMWMYKVNGVGHSSLYLTQGKDWDVYQIDIWVWE